ncbi:MAG: type I methionyl aminopeptidase, partial [bacterium]
MVDAGKRLREVIRELRKIIEPGITTKFIDQKAEEFIIKQGGEPSFNKVDDYSWSTCVPVNEQIVHTPPSDRVLLNGDLLTVDIGLYKQGFHIDFATSFIVGSNKDKNTLNFLKVGRDTLYQAIKVAIIGNHIGDISKVIQTNIEGNKFNVSETLVGHGIGHDLHEDPLVPGILTTKIERTPKIEKGLVIAIEVICMMGKRKIVTEKDDTWSIKTADNSLSAC